MRVLSFPERLARGPTELIPRPFVRYVLGENEAAELIISSQESGIRPVSSSLFSAYERRFALPGKPGERVLVWRHGAFGDALIASGVVAALRRLAPETRFDVWTDEQAVSCFRDATTRVFAGPIPFDAAIKYHRHLLFDLIYEADQEPEQQNAYDQMLAWSGADPETVPDEWKRPRLDVRASDSVGMDPAVLGALEGVRYVVLQASPNNPVRAWPDEHGSELVRRLREAGVLVVIVGSGVTPAETAGAARGDAGVMDLVGKTRRFEHLIPIVAGAACVVCPDSSIGHLAAAFPSVPVVSLWGPFDPRDRVRYYSNHRPLSAFDVCPYAPCRPHSFEIPQSRCKDATNATAGEQRACNALRAVTPARVVAEVLAAIGATAPEPAATRD